MNTEPRHFNFKNCVSYLLSTVILEAGLDNIMRPRFKIKDKTYANAVTDGDLAFIY